MQNLDIENFDVIEKLKVMGEQIKQARLRRRISVKRVMELSGVSRTTLWQIEKGCPSVAIGHYASVLHAINNLDDDLLLIAKDEVLDSVMKEYNLKVAKRVR